MYDFNVNIGDTVNVIIQYSVFKPSASDIFSVKYGMNTFGNVKIIAVYPISLGINYLYHWIEGLGSSKGLNIYPSEYDDLYCFSKNDTVFYQSASCTNLHTPYLYIVTIINSQCFYFNNNSVAESSKNEFINIYPNPTTGFVNLEILSAQITNYNFQIKIFDTLGEGSLQ
jgi:hypothetical protein